MIKIGKSYIMCEEAQARLCADISFDKTSFTLWFSVNTSQEAYLSVGLADAFVIAVLPFVLFDKGGGRHRIVCEDSISARLHYQLENYFFPALVPDEEDMGAEWIQAAHRTESFINKINGAVGTVFSEDVNSLYTIMQHGKACEYPLTHLVVFNEGAFDPQTNGEEFQKKCRLAEQFAQEQDLQTVFVDTNLMEVIHKKFSEMSSFSNIACALALQGLFSVYLLSAECEAANFKLEKEHAACYDLLTAGCVSTESLSFHLCGAEIRKEEKARLVSAWTKTIHGINLHIDQEMKKESGGLPIIRKRKRESIEQGSTIRIGSPYIEKISGEVRLCSEIELHEQKQIMWFSVSESYGTYLVEDRADAFVIALLTVAMRERSDIVCAVPVTTRLLYQINQYLIPTMTLNMEEFHPVKVYAEPTDEVLECEGAVATGWTGGVDSMFTYMQNVYSANPVHRLTHLLIANNGAIIGDTRETFKKMIEKAKNGFAAETGMQIIGVDTNVQEILDENFLAVTDMRHAAVIIALQKLFHVFLESAAYGFSEFSFNAGNVAYYEMFLLKCFETNTTVFYSSGGSFSRMHKLKMLADFSLAQRYLHPCIYALRNNCCQCEKCIRTEVVLYGFGALERFDTVFDIEGFEENKDWYFAKILAKKELTNCRDALQLLRMKNIDLSGAQVLADALCREEDRERRSLLYRLFCRIQKWIIRKEH